MPAGDRGAGKRLALRGRQEKRRDAACSGGELQAAARGEVGLDAFGEHACEIGAADTLLECPQGIGRPGRTNQGHLRRSEAEGKKGGSVGRVVARDPQDGAAASETAEQKGRETKGGGVALAEPRDLVDAAARQSAPGQRPVDFGNAKRYGLGAAGGNDAFDPGNAGA